MGADGYTNANDIDTSKSSIAIVDVR